MSAHEIVVTDMSAYEEALRDRDRAWHWYPQDPRYRRSVGPRAQIGDIAYCGHVKDTPPMTEAQRSEMQECGACVRLMRIAGGRP